MTQNTTHDEIDIREYTLGLLKDTCPDMDADSLSSTADRLLGRATEEVEKRTFLREKLAKRRNMDPTCVVSKDAYEAVFNVKLSKKKITNNISSGDDVNDLKQLSRFSPTYSDPEIVDLAQFSPDGSSREASNDMIYNNTRISPTTMLNNENTGLTMNAPASNDEYHPLPEGSGYVNNIGNGYRGGYPPNKGFMRNGYAPNGYGPHSKGGFRNRDTRNNNNGVRFSKRGRPNNFNNNFSAPNSNNNHQSGGVKAFHMKPYFSDAPMSKRNKFSNNHN